MNYQVRQKIKRSFTKNTSGFSTCKKQLPKAKLVNRIGIAQKMAIKLFDKIEQLVSAKPLPNWLKKSAFLYLKNMKYFATLTASIWAPLYYASLPLTRMIFTHKKLATTLAMLLLSLYFVKLAEANAMRTKDFNTLESICKVELSLNELTPHPQFLDVIFNPTKRETYISLAKCAIAKARNEEAQIWLNKVQTLDSTMKGITPFPIYKPATDDIYSLQLLSCLNNGTPIANAETLINLQYKALATTTINNLTQAEINLYKGALLKRLRRKDEAKVCYQQVREWLEKQNHQASQWYYHIISMLPSAARKVPEQMNNDNFDITALSAKLEMKEGDLYKGENDQKALEHYKTANRLYLMLLSSNCSWAMSQVAQSEYAIGNISADQGDWQGAIDHLHRARNLGMDDNQLMLATALRLSAAYREQKNFAASWSLLAHAQEDASRSNETSMITKALIEQKFAEFFTSGKNHNRWSNYEIPFLLSEREKHLNTAINYLASRPDSFIERDAIQIYRDHGQLKRELAEQELTASKIELQAKDAEISLNKALIGAEIGKHPDLSCSLYRELAKVKRLRRDFKTAITYLDRSLDYADDLPSNNAELNQTIEEKKDIVKLFRSKKALNSNLNLVKIIKAQNQKKLPRTKSIENYSSGGNKQPNLKGHSKLDI